MVRIRLRRVGAKKQPSYRVVVADSRSPRDGRFVEVIGFYNPRTEPETVTIKEDRALHWLSVGAQPSRAVARLLKNQGTLARFERLKQGESLEVLLADAAEAAQAAAELDSETPEESVEAEAPDLEEEPLVAEIEAETKAEEEGTTELTEGGDEDEEADLGE
jgi:small subunit ribosomal protein S16